MYTTLFYPMRNKLPQISLSLIYIQQHLLLCRNLWTHFQDNHPTIRKSKTLITTCATVPRSLLSNKRIAQGIHNFESNPYNRIWYKKTYTLYIIFSKSYSRTLHCLIWSKHIFHKYQTSTNDHWKIPTKMSTLGPLK